LRVPDLRLRGLVVENGRAVNSLMLLKLLLGGIEGAVLMKGVVAG
jgi:hypothetical protein